MKQLKLFSAIVLASLILAACAAPTAAPAPAPTQAPAAATAAPAATVTNTPVVTPAPNAVKITFWSWVPHVNEFVDEFNKTHPDVYVDYVNAGGGSGEYNKLKVALQANTGIPDVVQIEYQLVPSFIAQGALLDLTAYGANDLKSQFVPWTVTQVSSGNGIYALPQDSGPMVMFCNDAVLQKYNIKVPTTWDEFATAAAAIHKADSKVYLTNFTYDQGWFFGVLWQAGGRPFTWDGGSNVSIDFTSDAATKVANYWDTLIKSGNLSPVDTYTNDWNTALGNGTVACWPTGAWGTFIQGSSKDYAGHWNVYPMPAWKAGDTTNGNYGGSSIAITKATKHPKEAMVFNTWLNTAMKATLGLTDPAGAGLFPVTLGTLNDPSWKDVKFDFWSGAAIHQTMMQAATGVDPNFTWSPFTDFVFTTYADEMTKVKSGSQSYAAALKNLQDKTIQFAKDQGFTVK